MKKVPVIFFPLLLSFMARAQVADSFSYPVPENMEKLDTIRLWATQYYVHGFNSGGKIVLRNEQGQSMGLYADTCDFCKASLEGTAFVTDSAGNTTVVNFAGRADTSFVDCRKCPAFAKSPLKAESWGSTLWSISSGFGNGVKNYRLVPFRTIVVDPQSIPYGTVIYIPAVKGMTITLPNGEKTVHDGYFFAGDTGGAIKGNHIDIFTGTDSGNPFPGVITSKDTGTFKACIVTDPAIIASLQSLHAR